MSLLSVCFFHAEDCMREFCLCSGLGGVYRRQGVFNGVVNVYVGPRRAKRRSVKEDGGEMRGRSRLGGGGDARDACRPSRYTSNGVRDGH